MTTYQVTAEEEFARNEELRKEDVQELREWMRSKPNLPHVPDEQLILFLHSCYYSVSCTKDCISAYFRLREESPEVFTNRDLQLPDIKKIIRVMKYVNLPCTDDNGYHIIFHGLNDTEPSNYSFAPALKVFLMLVDACLVRNGTCPGLVFILDSAGLRFGHILRLSLSLIRRALAYIQEGIPIRLKAIHVLNTAFAVNQIMVMLKPLMNRELYSMIHFHKGNNETLYQFVPKRCLPKEYGGFLPIVAELHEKTISELELLDRFFKEEEELRTLKPVDSASLM